MTMKIDAHQHFWNLNQGDYDWLTPDLKPIYRDFSPADLKPLLTAAGIGGTIVVQATDAEAETEYLLSLAQAHDWILGVVGWVDMAAANAPERIAYFAKNQKFVGIRPMIQGLDDDAWMLRPGMEPAISALVELGLTFDALILPRHLTHLQRFLDMYPDLPVVIDHGAKPDIHNGHFQTWADQIKFIAANSKAYCKFSGLVTEASPFWNKSDIKPFANQILEAFGPERVMFGSDWPVVNLASNYGEWFEIAQNLCQALTESQREAVFGGNAYKFYLRR